MTMQTHTGSCDCGVVRLTVGLEGRQRTLAVKA